MATTKNAQQPSLNQVTSHLIHRGLFGLPTGTISGNYFNFSPIIRLMYRTAKLSLVVRNVGLLVNASHACMYKSFFLFLICPFLFHQQRTSQLKYTKL